MADIISTIIQNDETIEDFIREKIEQRMNAYRKYYKEARETNDSDKIKKYESKLEAYIDIWSFLEEPKN